MADAHLRGMPYVPAPRRPVSEESTARFRRWELEQYLPSLLPTLPRALWLLAGTAAVVVVCWLWLR